MHKWFTFIFYFTTWEENNTKWHWRSMPADTNEMDQKINPLTLLKKNCTQDLLNFLKPRSIFCTNGFSFTTSHLPENISAWQEHDFSENNDDMYLLSATRKPMYFVREIVCYMHSRGIAHVHFNLHFQYMNFVNILKLKKKNSFGVQVWLGISIIEQDFPCIPKEWIQ